MNAEVNLLPLEDRVQHILEELRLDGAHDERIFNDRMFFVLQAKRNFSHTSDISDVSLRTYLLTEATMYKIHYTFDEKD